MNNLIAAIRNAYKANKSYTIIKTSKTLYSFLDILKINKYILTYSILKNKKVKLYIIYSDFRPCISNIINLNQKISFTHQDLWKFNQNFGLIILTTSAGIITHKDALKKGIGGKACAYIF